MGSYAIADLERLEGEGPSGNVRKVLPVGAPLDGRYEPPAWG